MRIDIDTPDLARALAEIGEIPAEVRRKAWAAVRVVSFDAERMIKIAMPVKTGRARGSWGHSFPPALPSDGVWKEAPEQGSITQGSRVPYIERLNAGSSVQAPAGFIDAAEVRAQRQLEAMINSIDL